MLKTIFRSTYITGSLQNRCNIFLRTEAEVRRARGARRSREEALRLINGMVNLSRTMVGNRALVKEGSSVLEKFSHDLRFESI